MIGPWASRSTNFRSRRRGVLGFFWIAVISIIVLRLFVLDMAYVEGKSMAPTISPGRVVVVNKLAYGIRRPFRYGYILRWGGPRAGEIISVRNPRTGDLLVKRAAAQAGTAVALEGSTLTITLAERAFDVTVFGGARRYFDTVDAVPDSSLLVLGDNPTYSIDSRHFGPVSTNLVAGRVARTAGE